MNLEVLIAVESNSTVGEGQIKHWQIFFLRFIYYSSIDEYKKYTDNI